MAANNKPSWLGFRGYDKVTEEYTSDPTAKQPTKTTYEYQPGKTLWDWLQLLGVLAIPLVVAGATLLFGIQQAQLANDQQQQALLETYLDHMSTWLIDKHLRESQPQDEVRNVAHAETLSILRKLDPDRKVILLKFLYDSGLIGVFQAGGEVEKSVTVIFLTGADFRGVQLRKAFLFEADLSGADLSDADLRDADLFGVDLSGADLSRADLSGADLSGASLLHAQVTSEQLAQAKSLKDTIMPDGSIHP